MNATQRFARLVLALATLLSVSSRRSEAQFAFQRTAFWQDTAGSGLVGSAQDGDNFGKSLATGDFNGDGHADLAAFDRESSVVANAGAVRVQYGNITGVSSADVLITDFFPPSGPQDEESGDEFGFAIAAGDFNGDGFDDIAIGVPGEDVLLGGAPYTDCGSVLVLEGSAVGLTNAGLKLYPTAIGDKNFARFGHAVAAGDFDVDGYDELVVGAPGLDNSGQDQSGVIAVLAGGPVGLSTLQRHIHQDASDATGSVSDVAEPLDRFGEALVVGNFNGDTDGPGGPPVVDLAVGAPGEGDATAASTASGLVHIFYGSTLGTPLAFSNDQSFSQAISPGQAIETGDAFGRVLAAGDVNGDGMDDLLVAAPSEDVVDSSTIVDAGVVTFVPGAFPFVVTTATGTTFGQADFAVGENPEAFDLFGLAMAVADFDRNGLADIVVGSPFDDVVDPITFLIRTDAGIVHFIPGWSGAFPEATLPPRLVGQRFSGHSGILEAGDQYATALAAGDFDGDGHPDLAVGSPGEDVSTTSETVANSGGFFVLAGSLFSDGFEIGNAGYWSAVAP
jgi:hypothetical protein